MSADTVPPDDCFMCRGTGKWNPDPKTLAMAQAIVDSGPDTRTPEQIIADGVAFVMGPGGDEGTRMLPPGTSSDAALDLARSMALLAAAREAIGPANEFEAENELHEWAEKNIVALLDALTELLAADKAAEHDIGRLYAALQASEAALAGAERVITAAEEYCDGFNTATGPRYVALYDAVAAHRRAK